MKHYSNNQYQDLKISLINSILKLWPSIEAKNDLFGELTEEDLWGCEVEELVNVLATRAESFPLDIPKKKKKKRGLK